MRMAPQTRLRRVSGLPVTLTLLSLAWLGFAAALFQDNPADAQEPNLRRPTGYRPATEEELKGLRRSGHFFETAYVKPDGESLAAWPQERVAMGEAYQAYAYPPSVDLTATGYLPPVGNQGTHPNCSFFSVIYYYKTYQECREHGWDASLPEHIASPAFIYNMCARGLWSSASIDSPATDLCLLGSPPLSLMPYSGTACDTFPSEAAWRSAARWRAQSVTRIEYDSASPPSLAAFISNLKQNLANGDPVVVGMIVGDNWYGYAGGDGDGYDHDVIYARSGPTAPGHAVTLVGYDDGKSYSVSGQPKSGAFRFVNSWGTSWGMAGFGWLAYDYFAGMNGVCGVTMADRSDYAPQLLGSVRFDHPNASLLSLAWGIGDAHAPDGAAIYLQALTGRPYYWIQYGGWFPGGGMRAASDPGQGIVVDLTDLFNPPRPLGNIFCWVMDEMGGSHEGRVVYMALEDGEGNHVCEDTPAPTRDPKTHGAPATELPVGEYSALAFGPDGTLYIAEILGYRVRKVAGGWLYDFAGTGEVGFAGDGGPAVDAGMDGPEDVAVDTQGRVCISDGSRVRRVDTNGIITTIESGFLFAVGIDVDAGGSIYIADGGDHRVYRRDPDGSLHVIAGTGTPGHSGDEGPATAAELNRPVDVAMNPVDGNIYLIDDGNQALRRIDPAGVIHACGSSNSDPTLHWYARIACSATDGTVYFTGNTYPGRVYAMAPGGAPYVYGTYSGEGDPSGIALDAAGVPYVSLLEDVESKVVRMPVSGPNLIIAGGHSPGYGNPMTLRVRAPSGARIAWDRLE